MPTSGRSSPVFCDKAGKLGYKVMLEQAKPDFIKERRHIDMYERRFVDGHDRDGCSTTAIRFLGRLRRPQTPADRGRQLLRRGCGIWTTLSATTALGPGQVMNYLLQLGHTVDRV